MSRRIAVLQRLNAYLCHFIPVSHLCKPDGARARAGLAEGGPGGAKEALEGGKEDEQAQWKWKECVERNVHTAKREKSRAGSEE